jgi:ERCC4-type nuclease
MTTVQIVFDCREHALIAEFANFQHDQITIDKQQLSIGDIEIKDLKTQQCILIERKTVDDLASSIQDGRYSEQSFRLNGVEQIPNHNIYYLIEGNIHKEHHGITKHAIYSAMFSLSYYKGFSLLRTQNVEETSVFILSIAKKLLKESNKRQPFHLVVSEQVQTAQSNQNYCNVVKKVKKENITTEAFGEIVLCQIPGVSAVTAIAIMAHYKKFQILLDDTNKEATLNTLKTGSRKLGKNVVSNIVSFLTNW